jgi:pSer/pThr/pTyr-binding forkhead associated (FHA) protein
MSDTLSALVSRPRRISGKPALFVGIVADSPRSAQARVSLAGIDRVEIARGDGRKVERKVIDGVASVVVTLADPRMSSKHARLSKLGTTWIVEDVGSRNGTWIGSQRITRKPLIDGEALIVGHTALVFRDEGGEGDDNLDGVLPEILPGIRTLSPGLAARYQELATAAGSSSPIHLGGPQGTNKERLARAVHAASSRSGRFVTLNCGALPATPLETELFGDGTSEGMFRAAAGGTLFLDELTELQASSQAALLRALDSDFDVRIITGSHRDLDVEVTAGRFDADLRARLRGTSIDLPPLRDRLEDLGLIVGGMIPPEPAITFSVDALGALYAHDWPLDDRELDRTLTAALAVTDGRIEISHLPASVGDTESIDDEEPLAAFGSNPVLPISPAAPAPAPPLSEADRVLRDKLVEVIARHGGNLAAVARELGKDRTQIRRWMKRFGLTRDAV